MSEHTPDRDKIPAVLRSLPWEKMTLELLNQGWYDMDQFLVLVPVCWDQRASPPDGEVWDYEIHTVTVCCDEDCLSVESYDECWGWGLADVDFFVRLT